MSANGGVVIVAIDHPATRMLYHALSDTTAIRAVVVEERIPRERLLRARVRRLGVVTVLGQVAFQAILAPYLRARSATRAGEIARQHGLRDAPLPMGAVVHVPSVNVSSTIDILRGLSPRVVLLSGTRIVSRDVLRGVAAPFLNVHAGITPLYRGVHGGYWALAQGDRKHCGVTVHLVDEGIDTGGIVAQATIEPTGADDITTYPLLQLAAAVPLVRRAVDDAQRGTLRSIPPPAGRSRVWSHPTLWGYLYRRLTRGVR